MRGDTISKHTRLSWLTLFASTGTLICCALPILLVVLGFGSAVAAMTRRYPFLVTLSEYEGWMFGISGGLLGLTAWFIWGREAQCPAEPKLAELCERSRVINRYVFWFAICIWLVGFSARFLLLPIRNWLGI